MAVQMPLGCPPCRAGCGHHGSTRPKQVPFSAPELGATWQQLSTACLQTLLTTFGRGAEEGRCGGPCLARSECSWGAGRAMAPSLA